MAHNKSYGTKRASEEKQKENIIDTLEREAKGEIVAAPETNSVFKIREDSGGVNTQFMLHSLEIATLPKIDTMDSEAVKSRIIEYFTICGKNDKKPSVEGLSLAFGVDRKTLGRWRNGHVNKPQAVRDYINWAYNIINSQIVDYAQDGKMNTLFAFFIMRNNLGYTNADVPDDRPDNPMGEQSSGVEIAEKYQDLVED